MTQTYHNSVRVGSVERMRQSATNRFSVLPKFVDTGHQTQRQTIASCKTSIFYLSMFANVASHTLWGSMKIKVWSCRNVEETIHVIVFCSGWTAPMAYALRVRDRRKCDLILSLVSLNEQTSYVSRDLRTRSGLRTNRLRSMRG